jgi:F-type H+-transporting ATPase subunit b
MDLLNTLNIEPKAIAVNLLGFLALWFVSRKMVFIPIANLLAERKADIDTTYDKIDADRKQMETLKSDYEQRLATIEAEAREKIQSAIKEAQSARDQILDEANTRSRDMITRAEQEVSHEREQAMISLREQVVDLALGAATRVIGDGLDENRQRRLIAEFIAGPDANFGTSTGIPTAPVAAPAAPVETVAPVAPAAKPAPAASDKEDLSTLEALKPSAAKSAVRSALKGIRKSATSEGGAATGPVSETPTNTPEVQAGE